MMSKHVKTFRPRGTSCSYLLLPFGNLTMAQWTSRISSGNRGFFVAGWRPFSTLTCLSSRLRWSLVFERIFVVVVSYLFHSRKHHGFSLYSWDHNPCLSLVFFFSHCFTFSLYSRLWKNCIWRLRSFSSVVRSQPDFSMTNSIPPKKKTKKAQFRRTFQHLGHD